MAAGARRSRYSTREATTRWPTVVCMHACTYVLCRLLWVGCRATVRLLYVCCGSAIYSEYVCAVDLPYTSLLGAM